MIAEAHKVDPRAEAPPSSRDEELARATAVLRSAEAAHRKAEEEKEVLENTQSWKKSEIDALRKQMEAELSVLMAESPSPEKHEG